MGDGGAFQNGSETRVALDALAGKTQQVQVSRVTLARDLCLSEILLPTVLGILLGGVK